VADTIELKDKGLKQLMRAFKEHMPTARVGILGSKDHRSQGDANSNATIGAAHEYGTEELPERSFLRMPITTRLGIELEKNGAFDKGAVKRVIAEGSIKPWMEKVAITAETCVQDAFDSGGFGQWPRSNMEDKTNHQTLVETQQLRNGITSEVK
jgi:hypothetical protein